MGNPVSESKLVSAGQAGGTSRQGNRVMRRFTLGAVSDRKIVTIDRNGSRLTVLSVLPDGATNRREQELPSETSAKSAVEKLAQELLARGYVEQHSGAAKSAKPASAAAKRAQVVLDDEDDPYPLSDLADEATESPVPVLRRLEPTATAAVDKSADRAPKKKKKKAKKRQQAGAQSEKLAMAGAAAVGVLLLGGLGFIIYDVFLRPSSIVGTWRGSNTEYEIGHPIIVSHYELILDDQKHASMTLEKDTSIGTYSVAGGRLKLSFKDEDGNSSKQEFKIILGRVSLELKEPETGKLLVQLIRSRDPAVVGKVKDEAAAAPTERALSDPDKVDTAAEAKLASLEMSAKDSAFRLRYPKGWETDTGSRPDNTFSWVKLTKDSALIDINADIQGSVMSGSDVGGQYEEGSEMAPVHRAHELYKKLADQTYSDFKESKPALFKGSPLGEGRLSIFTASTGGLFGSKLRGYHVTFLTRDRRVTILCQCPEKDFPRLKASFLAVCRSLGR